MKKKREIMILLLGLIFWKVGLANDEPIMVTKVIGNEKEIVFMHRVVKGPINLFYETTSVTEYTHTKEHGFIPTVTKEIEVFYIGRGVEVEQINAGNYKRLLKKYLAKVPKLQKQLTEEGGLYKNLSIVISAYNKSKTTTCT